MLKAVRHQAEASPIADHDDCLDYSTVPDHDLLLKIVAVLFDAYQIGGDNVEECCVRVYYVVVCPLH